MAKSTDETLTQPQAAALLGVSARRLRQRDSEENPPPKDAAGRYPCKLYGEWLKRDWRRGLGVTDDGTAYDQPGEVLFSEATVDELTGQVTMRGEFPNTKNLLLPGLYVRVAVEHRMASGLNPCAARNRPMATLARRPRSFNGRSRSRWPATAQEDLA